MLMSVICQFLHNPQVWSFRQPFLVKRQLSINTLLSAFADLNPTRIDGSHLDTSGHSQLDICGRGRHSAVVEVAGKRVFGPRSQPVGQLASLKAGGF